MMVFILRLGWQGTLSPYRYRCSFFALWSAKNEQQKMDKYQSDHRRQNQIEVGHRV